MEISEEKLNRCLVLKLHGRLDTVHYNILESKISELMDRREYNLLLDCSELEYVSSSGLRILLMAMKKINHMHGKLVLCGLQPGIADIFRISGFVSIFEIFDTKEKAFASF